MLTRGHGCSTTKRIFVTIFFISGFSDDFTGFSRVGRYIRAYIFSASVPFARPYHACIVEVALMKREQPT